MVSPENKAWLDFSSHVTKLEKEGAFAEPCGAFVYSLKERQSRELRRMILAQRSTQLPAYVDILSRPDLVDASDIKFLTESLKAREYWILMKGLTLKSSREWLQQGGRWKDQVESRPPDPQLLSILLGGAPSADPEDEGVHKSDMASAFRGARLFDLTGAVLGDKNGALYARLETNLDQEETQLVRHQVETSLLKDIPFVIDAAPGEPNTFGFKHYPGNDDPLVTAWLASYQRFKSLPDAGQELDLLRIRARFELYLEGLPEKPKAYHVPCLRTLLAEQISHVGEQLFVALSQKSAVALQCFGNTKNKWTLGNMPQEIFSLVTSIKMSATDPDLAKRLLGQLFIAVVNGKRPAMTDNSVIKVMHEVRDDIDWKFCVSKLNTKGRAYLMEHFDDSKYYVEHLGTRDRGRKFTQELGV